MTAQECIFCVSREQGGGALKATGVTQTRVSRYDGQPLQRYQLVCITCGYVWWFAGHWARDKYQEFMAEHPDHVAETPIEPPAPDVIPQRSIPGTRILQTNSGLTPVGKLANDFKKLAAGDHEDVA